MPRQLRSFNTDITVTDGVGSVNVVTLEWFPIRDAGGFIRQVIVTAPREDTLFNFRIENANSKTVYRKKNQTGEIVDSCEVPVIGNLTFYVYDSSIPSGVYNMEVMFFEDS